jgi:hypothetical protein
MQKLLSLLLVLALAGTASAQRVAISNDSEGGIQIPSTTLQQCIPVMQPAHAAAPLADDIKLSYYDESAIASGWQAPFAASQSLAVLQYAQRFTLPTETGTLDSIKVRFSQAAGDTVYLYLMEDSVFTLQSGDAHLPTTVFGGIAIPVQILPQIVDENGWVTITFDHVPVAKNFHVLAAPRIIVDGTSVTPTSSLTVIAENKSGVTPTTESSRSTFVALAPGGIFNIPMDNYFSVDGTPVAVNFHMQAFVNVETGSVARPSIAAAAMFPNPVASNGTLNIQHNEQIEEIQIVNMLGNAVQSWTGKSSNVKLSTSELPAGVYNVIVTTAKGITSEKLIVN